MNKLKRILHCKNRVALLVSLLVLLMFSSCAIFKNTGSQRHTISKKERFSLLHGKVKTLTIRTFAALKKGDKIVKGDGIARMDYPPKTIYYNRQQQVTKLQKLNTDGSVYSTTTKTYNAQGNQIAHKVFDHKKQLLFKALFQYDAKGRVILKKNFAEGELHTKRKIFYNDADRIIKEIWYSYDGNNIDTTTYTYAYNQYGDRIELTAKKNGQMSFQTFNEYTYDRKGQLLTKKEMGAETGLEAIWKYNQQGNVELKKAFEPDGSLNYKEVFTYDKAGNKIEEKVFEAGDKLINRRTSTYKGKMYISKTFWPSGELDYKYTYQYTFDDHGNWIKEIEFMNEDPYSITIRKIEYYDE